MSQVPRGRGRGRGKKTTDTNKPGPQPLGSQPVSSTSQQPDKPSTTSPPPPPHSKPARSAGRGRGRGQPQSTQNKENVGAVVSAQAPAQTKVRYGPDGQIINPHAQRKFLEPLKRKDYGTEGRPIQLYTNFYEIKYSSSMKIYQYDVQLEISEKILKSNKMLALEIFNKMVQEYRETYFSDVYPVFDGAHIMYTNKKIENLDKMVRLPVTYATTATRQDSINITVSPTSRIIDFADIDDVYNKQSEYLPYNLFSCADIILGFMPKMSYVNYGRNYFPRGQNAADLGSGIQLWSGSVMAVKPGQWKLLVNVDEKHTAFYKAQNLKDFVNDLLPHKNSFNKHEITKISDHLKGLQIKTEHLGYSRKYRIYTVHEEPANRHQITDNATGARKTIDQYYREKNICLKYPQMPCVQVEPRNRQIFIPFELGTIVEGQRCIRNLTERQVAEIIKTSAKKPDVKKRHIDSSANKLFQSSHDFAQQYGLTIDRNPLKIKGRVLQPPSIQYAQGLEKPRGGVWRSKRLRDTKSLNNWGIVSMAPQNKFNLKDFTTQLRTEGRNFGICISDPLLIKFVLDRDFETEVCRMLNQKPQLNYLFVILPQFTHNGIYSMVKEVEVEYGVITQCVRLETVQKKFKAQTVGNVLLKTNTKLGGTNWEVADMSPVTSRIGTTVFSEPVMIIGADVTHWAKGEGNKPSIAGVVCSLDNRCSQYASRIALQQHRMNRTSDEIIRNFKDIVKDLLKTYRRSSGLRPGKILYFRDGVSQGQFIQTLTEEIAGIQAACTELEQGYQPKITYINAQKRHHTRLYCADHRDTDRSGNVPPGTVVDREITNPIHFDFYLNSHAGIQGTNRPCHYTVLWDDSDLSPDLIQLLTYYLCHTYARCSRSVSYPAPTYYAHLLCARARTMLSAMRLDWYNTDNPPNLAQVEKKLSQNKSLENVTYFI